MGSNSSLTRLLGAIVVATLSASGCSGANQTSSTAVTSELRPSEIAASAGACVKTNMTQEIVPPPSDIHAFDAEAMGLYFTEVVDGTTVHRIEWGQIGNPDDVDWIPYSSVAEGDLLATHAKLMFNHRRVDHLLVKFLGLEATEVMMDDHFDEPSERARWDGERISFADGTILPFVISFPSPSVDSQPVSPDRRDALWNWAENWAASVDEIMVGGIDSLRGLRDHDLEAVRLDLCVLLDTEFALTEGALGRFELPDPHLYSRELAVQELLLLNEYLIVIRNVLEQPDINWLEGAEIDRESAFDGVTSTGEYLGMWQLAGLDLISRFAAFVFYAPE